jgi:hypothetical protein
LLRRGSYREKTFNLCAEFADLFAREMENIERAAIVRNFIYRNDSLLDK